MLEQLSPAILDATDLPQNFQALSREDALKWGRWVIERLEPGVDNFAGSMLPLRSRVNVPLTGTYDIHDRVNIYDPKLNLSEIVEQKINRGIGPLIILATKTRNKYYSFIVHRFCYSLLDEVKEKTYSLEYIVIPSDRDVFFCFQDDFPMGYISYGTPALFKEDFGSLGELVDIFSKHKLEWRMTTRESEKYWLIQTAKHFEEAKEEF